MKEIQQHTMAGLFPAIEDVPETVKLHSPLFQKQILINGELIEWDGPTHLVTSPVHVHSKQTGTIAPLVIGSYPLGTIKEADLALQAAVQAYDHGRGAWPSRNMQERIERLEDFTFKMVSKREEIIKLILWEIGKTIGDA